MPQEPLDYARPTLDNGPRYRPRKYPPIVKWTELIFMAICLGFALYLAIGYYFFR